MIAFKRSLMFFLIFVDFILKKVITFVWKKMRCRFVLIPNFPGAELSFSTGAEMSWCWTVLFPLQLSAIHFVNYEQINSCEIQYNIHVPELVSLLVLHVVWLWLDTFFAQFFTGMSKLSQILSIIFNVDLYELHKPALLNVL